MRAGILNQGRGAWAFSELADQLSSALRVPVVEKPAELNYVLFWDRDDVAQPDSFVPWRSIEIAGDKRTQARLFAAADVPSPETLEFHEPGEVVAFVRDRTDRQWVLKYPIGCGAAGHRILELGEAPPTNWPAPLLLQEFVAMREPEVYRLYAAGGTIFGWNARRFPADARKRSPWVAHATGARYTLAGPAPAAAAEVARRALLATNLLGSFGCVDLLHSARGWLALEVGTDGLNNYVDRDVPEPLRTEIDRHIAEAFHRYLGSEMNRAPLDSS